jgi:hypothetical protein
MSIYPKAIAADSPAFIPDAVAGFLDRHKTLIGQRLLFLMLPTALLLLTLVLHHVRGPYWIAVYDPEYAYLLNSLQVAQMQTPTVVHHPGTPLQILGAVVLRTSHFFWGQDQLADDVLRKPEFYLRAISYTFLACYFLVLSIIGLVVWRCTSNRPLALLMQGTPLLSLISVQYLPRVAPEVMNLLFTAVFSCILLVFLEKGSPTNRRYVWLLGFLGGLNIASKFTALPLAIIPLILLSTWRGRLGYALITVATFLLATLPAWPSYHFLFMDWLFNIATHTDTYGSGSPGLLSIDSFVNFLGLLCRLQFFLLFTVLGTLVVGTQVFFYPPASDAPGNRKYALGLLAVGLAQVLQILLVAKHPNERYLLPSLALLGLNWTLLFCLLQKVGARTACISLACLLGLWLVAWQCPDIVWRVSHFKKLKAARMAFIQEVREKYADAPLIYGPRAYSFSMASYVANVWSGKEFGDRLAPRFPGTYFCHPGMGSHWEFGDFNHPLPLKDYLSLKQVFYVNSSIHFPPRGTGVTFEKVFEKADQVLYRMVREPGAEEVSLHFNR